jgi:hypothetical protein
MGDDKHLHILVTKNVWRMIQGMRLWAHDIKEKYFPQYSIVEWIRKRDKRVQKGSIIWKVIINYFPLIRK